MKMIGTEEKSKWEKFQVHWLEICKKFESNGVSKQDAEDWRERFEMDRNVLRIELVNKIGSLNQGYMFNPDAKEHIKIISDIISEKPRFNDKFNMSLQAGRYKYRNNERINLKEHYGFLGDLIHIIRKLVGWV